MTLLSFDQVLEKSEGRNRHLMLGNGFSIALKPDIFTYGSLYDNADFQAAPYVPQLFDALQTRDFEVVIRHLEDSARIVEVYRPSLITLIARLRNDAAAVKDALASAIAKRHPDRPYDVPIEQYAACRKFLSHFNHLFTLNYDVLLYWALMQSEADDLDLKPDDGFRHPQDIPDLPWVSWQQANSARVNYLHGALHLFDAGTDIIKYTWSKTDIPIVDQIRSSLDNNRFPIFVAEGDSDAKRARIWHSAYLHKALRSFEGCCKSSRSAIFIYGHSLADNDDHILRVIAQGGTRQLFVSIYGDILEPNNLEIVQRAHQLAALRKDYRSEGDSLEIEFFDAESAHVWG